MQNTSLTPSTSKNTKESENKDDGMGNRRGEIAVSAVWVPSVEMLQCIKKTQECESSYTLINTQLVAEDKKAVAKRELPDGRESIEVSRLPLYKSEAKFSGAGSGPFLFIDGVLVAPVASSQQGSESNSARPVTPTKK